MKNEDLDTMFGGIDPPTPEHIKHQQELKIPLLSYKKSSKAGLWLLLLPGLAAITIILRYEFGVFAPFLHTIQSFFNIIDRNEFLTYLIPVIFIGLPLVAMTLNLLAFCHFTFVQEKKELLIAVKYRPLNIIIFLLSFMMLLYFFLPDRLSF